MKFYENGRVLLTGKQFIDKIGAYELKAKPAQVSDLSQELDEMGFCDMKKMYGSDAMDFPSNIIKYQCGGEEKTVKAISNIPPPLVDFIEKVDGLRELDEWIKLDTVAEWFRPFTEYFLTYELCVKRLY